MFNIFAKRRQKLKVPWAVDIHSHLLPGLDDGVKSIEESIYILKILQGLGYRKVITTPHVMSDHYPNTNVDILTKLKTVQEAARQNSLDIEVQAAAEYYLDEVFIQKIDSHEEMLTFGDKYILFETSFFNKPAFLEDAIFKLNAQGYQPILAHPERYAYLIHDLNLLKKLKNMNVFLQMNLLSLAGHYGKDVKTFSRKLLKAQLIDFVGSDCHHVLHANELKHMLNRRNINTIMSQNILNKSLL